MFTVGVLPNSAQVAAITRFLHQVGSCFSEYTYHTDCGDLFVTIMSPGLWVTSGAARESVNMH